MLSQNPNVHRHKIGLEKRWFVWIFREMTHFHVSSHEVRCDYRLKQPNVLF